MACTGRISSCGASFGPPHAATNALSALHALYIGQPGFYEPRLPPPWLLFQGVLGGRSYYDASPLKSTLERLIDFDRINSQVVRLSVGAVNVRTGNFSYFDNMTVRIRPEHIMETRPHVEANQHDFDQMIDVVEPMGMETLVYFTVAGAEVCGRVNPNAGAVALQPMKLRADLSNMHLIDDTTGKVL